MGSEQEQLVPITREYLREFYKRFPIDPLNEKFYQMKDAMDKLSEDLGAAIILDLNSLELTIPKHLDRNMYFNRWQCEEVADKAETMHGILPPESKELPLLKELSEMARAAGKRFEDFQSLQASTVSSLVESFLPNDFRSRVLNKVRERKELKNKAAVDLLLQDGGSIADKYDLLWQQQWDRRQSLADLGNATGVWKAVVKLCSGCPEALLDFAKQINAPLGPTEEIRIKYGPNLYDLTQFINQAHVIACCALEVYSKESAKYLEFMTDVVSKSPFFVSAESAAKSLKSCKIEEDPFREVVVSRGYPYEEVIPLDDLTGSIVWQFTVNRETEFSIRTSSGTFVHGPELIRHTGEMEEGSLRDVKNDTFTVSWTNKAGMLRRVTLSYRLHVITDVNEADQEWCQEVVNRDVLQERRISGRKAGLLGKVGSVDVNAT